MPKPSKPSDKVDGLTYEMLLKKAKMFLNDHDTDSAINALEEALKLNENGIEAMLNIASLHINNTNIN